MTFKEKYAELKKLADEYLLLPELYNTLLGDAMLYSLNAGGKRIRPVLTLAFCEAYGGDIQKALPAAAAVEMLHTFTLIHDDLPCMDDDDLRRGKPSCHIAFSEAEAVLAGDALVFYALEKIAEAELPARIIKELCVLTGVKGVIGGQKLDMIYEGTPATTEQILKMYGLKTCALLQACCIAGCLTAGADETAVKNAAGYAYKLGLAFQIIDDILDETGDERTLGKPVKSDNRNKKRTYVSSAGLEAARESAEKYTREALILLENVPNGEFLMELTGSLLNRKM